MLADGLRSRLVQAERGSGAIHLGHLGRGHSAPPSANRNVTVPLGSSPHPRTPDAVLSPDACHGTRVNDEQRR